MTMNSTIKLVKNRVSGNNNLKIVNKTSSYFKNNTKKLGIVEFKTNKSYAFLNGDELVSDFFNGSEIKTRLLKNLKRTCVLKSPWNNNIFY